MNKLKLWSHWWNLGEILQARNDTFSIVNSVVMYEALQKSLSSQAAFYWPARWIHVTNFCIVNFSPMQDSQSQGFLVKPITFAHIIYVNEIIYFFICLRCEQLQYLLSNWWRCFLDLLVFFYLHVFSEVAVPWALSATIHKGTQGRTKSWGAQRQKTHTNSPTAW